MSKHYIYKMEIVGDDSYQGAYIGQHKIGNKAPEHDGYKGSGCKWKRCILSNHIPVKKTVIRLGDSLEEANQWEQYYIEQAIQNGEILWNVAKGGGGYDHDRIYTKEEILAHNKERFNRWYEANKEHFQEYNKRYRKAHKERVAFLNKQHKEKRKEFYTEYHRQYYLDHKEELSKRHKEYYEQHKELMSEHRREYTKQYNLTHAEHIAQRTKRYYEEHKEQYIERRRQPCCYNGETLTLNALTLRLRRENVSNPTQVAKQYLIKKGKEL